MGRITIANIAAEHLELTGNPGVMWGDCTLLDEISSLCDVRIKTHFLDLHPLIRHPRLLTAIERYTTRFKKGFISLPGKRGNNLVRYLELIKNEGGNDLHVLPAETE